MKRQNGFTLIELVMVIVILGVLAAVAMPKFIDLKSDAQRASVAGVAGAASSAAAINYAGCAIAGNAAGAKCVRLNTCDTVKNALSSCPTGSTTCTWPPAGGTAVFTAAASGTELGTSNAVNGTSNNCTLTLTDGSLAYTASFVIIGAGNP